MDVTVLLISVQDTKVKGRNYVNFGAKYTLKIYFGHLQDSVQLCLQVC